MLFLSVISMLHVLRIVAGWKITINDWLVPLWVNAILAVVTAALALMLWRENR